MSGISNDNQYNLAVVTDSFADANHSSNEHVSYPIDKQHFRYDNALCSVHSVIVPFKQLLEHQTIRSNGLLFDINIGGLDSRKAEMVVISVN
jgi:hypothetical protein